MPEDENERKLEQRLLAWMDERGFVQDGRSRWGQPLLRRIPSGCEPQRFADARPLQKRFVACAYGTPSPGDELCASWIEQTFSRLGLGIVLGDAANLCNSYCLHTDFSKLKVGMIVSVPAHPLSFQGYRHGHVGLYIGDNTIMDSVDSHVRTVPLSAWLSVYGLMHDPRWGWLGSIGLE